MKLIYDGTLEGFLSAVHICYYSKINPDEIASCGCQPDLFGESQVVETDHDKAEAVGRAIAEKIDSGWMALLHKALLSEQAGIEMAMLSVIQQGFKVGASVLYRWHEPSVQQFWGAIRATSREAHKFLGFTRFMELEDGGLFALIEPKHAILALIGEHFARRLPNEHWIVYDQKRHQAILGEGSRWRLLSAHIDGDIRLAEQEMVYQTLWRQFFDSVAIVDRENHSLQRQHVPLYTRIHMTEFQEG